MTEGHRGSVSNGDGDYRKQRPRDRAPRPPWLIPQATVPWWTPGEGRVDARPPDWRTIIEADGRRWHARVQDFASDRWRDNVAQAHGYRVLRFTYTHLRQRPDEVVTIV